MELLAANRTRIPVIGTVTVRARLSGRTITMDGLVSEHIQEVILGLDWLKSQGANWNFCEGKLTIGKETHVLLSTTRGMFCRRLVAQESVIIPARNEMDVLTMVIYDTLSAAKFDPGNVRSGCPKRANLEKGCRHVDFAPSEGCFASSDEYNRQRSGPRQGQSDG